MTYKTIALALSIPVDVDRIQRTIVYYANGKFHMEIYENGTCVLPKVLPDGKIESGRRLLIEISEHPIDFFVREMDDHNFVVQFSNFIFSVVFSDEYYKNRNEIIQQARAMITDEVLVTKPDSPPDHLYIGLYARTRLLEDIHAPTLARSVKPGP
jgi:hypothetical protein